MSKIILVGSLAESLVNFRGDLLRHLVAGGHDVLALAPEGPAWVDERLKQWGVRRATLPLQRTGTGLRADLRLARTLYGIFRRERPDAVLGYTIKPVVYGSIAARWAGVPRVVAMVTGLGFTFMPARGWRQQLVQRVARLLYAQAMRSAHAVLFQNPDDEAEFRAAGLLPARLEVRRINGSGINTERFACAPLPEGPPSFLLIGRLIADKGVREYLQAARLLKARCPEAQCHLVGPYDSNPSALSPAEVEAAVAEGSIVFHGAVQDVRPLLQACQVYVLPSYREGTPRSVLEALAIGRPVITTDAPGCRETVVHGLNGELVPVAQVQPLVDAMHRHATMSRADLLSRAAQSRLLAEAKYEVRLVNASIAAALIPDASKSP
jgi:glycosyltransferase involved in cell wall biosynthesis